TSASTRKLDIPSQFLVISIHLGMDTVRQQQQQARRFRQRERRSTMTPSQLGQRRENARTSYHQRIRNRQNEDLRLQNERINMSWHEPRIKQVPHLPRTSSTSRLTYIRRQARNIQTPQVPGDENVQTTCLSDIRRQARNLNNDEYVRPTRLTDIRRQARNLNTIHSLANHGATLNMEQPNDLLSAGDEMLGLPVDEMPNENGISDLNASQELE
ncbi:hypothetical protein FRX31_027091, partial [Thalictrum thalictroides]